MKISLNITSVENGFLLTAGRGFDGPEKHWVFNSADNMLFELARLLGAFKEDRKDTASPFEVKR